MSPSPAKDSRTTKKYSEHDSPGSHASASKRRKATKSPPKQYNSKMKLSETSLFAELVKDRQMRELAMKCLTQINTKTVDENEIVEIHDDSDSEQNNSKEEDSNSKLLDSSLNDDVDSCVIIDILENKCQTSELDNEVPNIKLVTSSISDMAPKIVEQNPTKEFQNENLPVSNEEIVENGVEHPVESITLEKTVPEVETKDLTKMPLPPVYPEYNVSPDSDLKCSRRSIKDLPLPPGK